MVHLAVGLLTLALVYLALTGVYRLVVGELANSDTLTSSIFAADGGLQSPPSHGSSEGAALLRASAARTTPRLLPWI